jgi:hypothetical protein
MKYFLRPCGFPLEGPYQGRGGPERPGPRIGPQVSPTYRNLRRKESGKGEYIQGHTGDGSRKIGCFFSVVAI